ncbi:efflux RND transporter periplasmic adaptor subunit [Thermoanaerobacterium sp. DL9XJH110]|uniref:efflux RND transporter periplasmic adaptor subunit n=1 Tax=Thermoanaerobacterium sp. DL9XJH110 TaxID=3386643 RepID=UPI003BB721A1
MKTKCFKSLYLILLMIFTVVFSGCGKKAADISQPEKTVTVKVAYSQKEDLAEYQSFPGKVAAADEVSLSAKMSGRVEKILVKEGDEVKAGQVLIKLEQTDVLAQLNQAKAGYDAAVAHLNSLKNGQLPQQIAQLQSAYNQAEANFKNAKQNYDRMKTLLEDGAISKQQFETAELQYNVAKEQYESARTQLAITREKTAPESVAAAEAQVRQSEAALSAAQVAIQNTLITSPIDGTVGFINVKVGQLISAGLPVATVGNLKSAEIVINVTEERVNALKVGQEAEVSVDSAGISGIKGRIVSISPFKDPKTQVYPVKILVPNEKGLLKSGMFARVRLVVALHPQVVTVPEEAVVDYDGTKIVYINEAGRARVQKVVTGPSSQGKIVIKNGLMPGKQLIVEGQDLLEDGTKVTVEGRGDSK